MVMSHSDLELTSSLFASGTTSKILLEQRKFTVPTGIKNGKGSTFMLELFIHEDMVNFNIILSALAFCSSSI